MHTLGWIALVAALATAGAASAQRRPPVRPDRIGTTRRPIGQRLVDLASLARPRLVTGDARGHGYDAVTLNPQPLPPREAEFPLRSGGRTSAERTDTQTSGTFRPPLPESAYAPHAIDFGELRTGDAAVANVSAVAPGDGAVRVRLSGDARFTIAKATPFLGRWEGISTEARPLFGASDQRSGRERERQVVVGAGQEVRVEVRFRAGGTGLFQGKLHLEGEGWAATIPLVGRATLLGPLAGALLVPDEYGLLGVVGTTLTVPVQVVSLANQPRTVRLEGANLPAGVSLEPFSIALGAGERKRALLRLRIDPDAPEARETPLVFTLDAGGPVKRTLTMSLNLYQPWIEYPFTSADGTIRMRGAVQIKHDGSWQFRAVADNNGPLLAERFRAGFWFHDGAEGRAGWEESFRAPASGTVPIERSGSSAWLKTNYARVVHQEGVHVALLWEVQALSDILTVLL